jgi:tRNA modification GTPase
LMNALLHSERVIVTAVAGATRDVVEDAVEILGLPVRLFDTAGIRDDAGEVERIGVGLARSALDSCDLALLVVDGSSPLTPDDRSLAQTLSGRTAIAVNKCDLPLAISPDQVRDLAAGAPAVMISALTGMGLADLERAIACALGAAPASGEPPVLTNARHIAALRGCRDALIRAAAARTQGLSDEFTASDLREALDRLGEITGETATGEILDLIFSRFCIGK